MVDQILLRPSRETTENSSVVATQTRVISARQIPQIWGLQLFCIPFIVLVLTLCEYRFHVSTNEVPDDRRQKADTQDQQ